MTRTKRLAKSIVKNVNLAKVRKALRYERVIESDGAETLRFEIEPQCKEWPSAYLVLGREPESGKYDVLQAGFGEWHGHFDDYRNPDRNVAAALLFLSEVVSGKVRLIAGYDKHGRYVESSLRSVAAPGLSNIHSDLGGGRATRYREFIFNRGPEDIGV